MVTPAQLKFIGDLLDERVINSELTADQLRAQAETLDKRTASKWIEKLLAQPRASKRATTHAPVAANPVGIGLFALDGEFYVTKPNRAKTGMYAERLVNTRTDRLTTDGKRVRAKFEYAPRVYARLTDAHRVPAAEAEKMALQFSNCIICGRGLEVADSVERGIGPVCYGRLTAEGSGPTAEQLVGRPAARAQEPPERRTPQLELPAAPRQTSEAAMMDRLEEKLAVQQAERSEDYRVAREKLERDIVFMEAEGADTSVQHSALAELREAEQV